MIPAPLLRAAARLAPPRCRDGHRRSCSSPPSADPATPPPRSFDSRCPLSTAKMILQPSVNAPIRTSSAALLSSSSAFTYSPSAHTYTTSRPSSRRHFQVSYSSCHCALSRWSESRDKGAPLPQQTPQRQFKIPSVNPCRYSSSPTCFVCRGGDESRCACHPGGAANRLQ